MVGTGAIEIAFWSPLLLLAERTNKASNGPAAGDGGRIRLDRVKLLPERCFSTPTQIAIEA